MLEQIQFKNWFDWRKSNGYTIIFCTFIFQRSIYFLLSLIPFSDHHEMPFKNI